MKGRIRTGAQGRVHGVIPPTCATPMHSTTKTSMRVVIVSSFSRRDVVHTIFDRDMFLDDKLPLFKDNLFFMTMDHIGETDVESSLSLIEKKQYSF
jgi:hypothetical protein